MNIIEFWKGLLPIMPLNILDEQSLDKFMSIFIYIMFVCLAIAISYIFIKYFNGIKSLDNFEYDKENHKFEDIESKLNLEKLECDFSRSRFLSNIPTSLTAFGVLGTFIGLQGGLEAVRFSNDLPVKELLGQIQILLGKASFAFSTSVWGVFTSLILSSFLRFMEGKIYKKIQKKIREIISTNEVHSIERLLIEELTEIRKNTHPWLRLLVRTLIPKNL